MSVLPGPLVKSSPTADKPPFPNMEVITFSKAANVDKPQILKLKTCAGKYRPFNPASGRKPLAVMFAIWDEKKQGEMSIDDIMMAETSTMAELTKRGIQVLLPADPGPSYDLVLKRVQAGGGDSSKIKRIDKSGKDGRFINHSWMRDWGPLPLRNMETGEWGTVLLEPGWMRGTSVFFKDWFEKNLKMPILGSYYVDDGQFAGGNIITDNEGCCISAGITHPLFGQFINCSTILTVPCRSQVCHADEYFVVLKKGIIATTKPEFIPALREAGFTQILELPADDELSFTNVLIVGKEVFMMYTDKKKEKMIQAKAVYEQAGYKVVPIKTGGCGENYGAIHCLTREIPKIVVPAR
ncbi:MAG TPA: hypothetical protein PLL10_03110 [Elusimicrobiales bacterium]|nr:hypothetical protein [Elusimicrobiales bacterium]